MRRALFLAFAFGIAACSESVGPQREAPRIPNGPPFAVTAATGITLSQYGSVMSERYKEIGQGFNAGNPHLGDAIVATFFWRGSTNTITRVWDHLSNTGATPAGNTYTLVEYVTAGGFSMATYVATNVQGFPDPAPDVESILNVDAVFEDTVSDAGVVLAAWTGVGSVTAQALGAHRGATGSATGITSVGPGPIAVGAGSLTYGVTMAHSLAGVDPPQGFTLVTGISDTAIVVQTDYAVQAAPGTVDAQWTWFFPDGPPSDWLTTVLALNPPLHFEFIIEPSTTLPTRPIEPAVQVMALDADGNRMSSFNGSVTIGVGRNGGTVMPGSLSGTTTVTAVDGVAVFANLSVDQLGNGYTLVVNSAGITSAESATFNIGAF
jgi:hypothetical protein